MESDRVIQRSREARRSFPPSFLEHAPESGIDMHVAHLLKDRGFNISFNPSYDKTLVEIHGNDERAKNAFFRVIAMPEISALMLSEEPVESSDKQIADHIGNTKWDDKTKRRVRAGIYKAAADQWRAISEHERNEEALRKAEENENKANSLLPEGSKHLTQREKQALAEEAVARAIPSE